MASDSHIPKTPETERVASTDDLLFRVSRFDDPDGADTFDAMEWRLAEITHPDDVKPGEPRAYEAEAVWKSGEKREFQSRITIPVDVARKGKTHRARVRVRDKSGRWSHWSKPVELGSR